MHAPQPEAYADELQTVTPISVEEGSVAFSARLHLFVARDRRLRVNFSQ